ncbi:MAG TPA: hypothetical protein VHC98_03615 [Candidatus Saccharimonadales bacterium]|nr:hypothetical protein [Candidatus Saccharimonadales bacterium]
MLYIKHRSFECLKARAKEVIMRAAKQISMHNLLLALLSFALCILLSRVSYDSVARADGLPVVHVSGTIDTDTTWSSDNVYIIDGPLSIPSGVTLSVDPGTIVKFAAGWMPGSISVEGGTLDAAGSSDSPIIFTSINDDSAGGDSAGDGPTTGATGDYHEAINSASGGTVEVTNAVFRYATYALDQYCTSGSHSTLTDNVFASPVTITDCPDSAVTLERNQFATISNINSPALSLESSDATIATVSGTDRNTFSGTGRDVVVYFGDNNQVPAGSTWSLDNTSGAIFESKTIYINGTVNISGGTIIKTYVGNSYTAFAVDAGGSLSVSGTSTNPVIFTSMNDDMVGGDSAGDGLTVGAPGNYSEAINSADGGTINVSYATFSFATYAVAESCGAGSSSVFTDNTFDSPVTISGCSSDEAILQRNQFAIAGDGYPALSLDSSDVTIATVSGADKNIFSGNNRERVIYLSDNDQVPEGSIWTIDNTSGAVFETKATFINGTLDIGPGAIIKSYPASSYGGFEVNSGGEVNVAGSSINPVIFTSLRDDSVGGDSADDGTTVGAPGDYGTAISDGGGGAVSVSHAIFRYATHAITIQGSPQVSLTDIGIDDVQNGLAVGGTAHVLFRGSFSNVSGVAISSCDWPTTDSDAECVVDATYTYWGNDDGPLPSSGSLVCGDVLTSPWKTSTSTTATEDVYADGNCDSSGLLSASMVSSASSFTDRTNALGVDCSGGMQDACDTMEREIDCMQSAYDIAKGNIGAPDLPEFTVDGLATGVLQKVGEYLTNLATEDGTGDIIGGMYQASTLMYDLNSGYNSCVSV